MEAKGAATFLVACLVVALPSLVVASPPHAPLAVPVAGLPLPSPEAEAGIGPGSALSIRYPDGKGEGCTANFIWTDGADLYLGTAGHCVLPDGATATHGPDADYDASGIVVRAAIEGCLLTPSTPAVGVGICAEQVNVPESVQLGAVAYARQGTVGRDFALVRIPEELEHLVRTQMPAWGGPQGSATAQKDDALLVYGHGLAYDGTPALRKRFGVAAEQPLGSGDRLYGLVPIYAGDSGGPVVRGVPTDDERLWIGAEAVGVITHTSVFYGVPVLQGTTIAQAKLDAFCLAGLSVHVVPGDAALPAGTACP